MKNDLGIVVVPYRPSELEAWNELIERSRNGIFLFNRFYMDYHADRFFDFSFLVYKKNKLEAVIPANRKGDVVYSHQGLTYGGVISSASITAVDMLEIFRQLLLIFKNVGVRSLIYKPVPCVYNYLPAEEDLYALFRNSACLIARQISSTIFQNKRLPFRELRERGAKKALKNNVQVKVSQDFVEFWKVLEEVLMVMHQLKPVHTDEEITRLAKAFPENIKLYVASINGQILAGTVLFITENVVHAQYMGASAEGKKIGALDLVFDHLITHVYKDVPVFDFGVSTEEGGKVLNETLIFQKEGFGGRGIVYDTWRIEIQ